MHTLYLPLRNLAANRLTAIPLGVFTNLPSLVNLYLSKNGITSVPPGFLSNLPNLYRMYVISSLSDKDDYILHLDRDLSTNRITYVDEKAFISAKDSLTVTLVCIRCRYRHRLMQRNQHAAIQPRDDGDQQRLCGSQLPRVSYLLLRRKALINIYLQQTVSVPIDVVATSTLYRCGPIIPVCCSTPLCPGSTSDIDPLDESLIIAQWTSV